MQHLKKHSFSGKTEREKHIFVSFFHIFSVQASVHCNHVRLGRFLGQSLHLFYTALSTGGSCSVFNKVRLHFSVVCLSNPMLVLKKRLLKE